MSHKVPSVCSVTTATGGEAQRKNVVAVLQYDGRRSVPYLALPYHTLPYLTLPYLTLHCLTLATDILS